jgi:cell division protein FtsQ
MFDALPLPEETIRRFAGWIGTGAVAAVALAVAFALHVPQLIGTGIGEAVGSAGFRVRHIEPKGIRHLDPTKLYRILESERAVAMPLVRLDSVRERLLGLGWVRDARVSRRWPDTLVVDIDERRPAAIWQQSQRLLLVDDEGVVLEPVRLEAMPDLPLLIGPGANRHSESLQQLLSAAPSLKPMVAGATWIGDRRWDLRFQSGEVLALPEGQDSAERALHWFVERDRKVQLLGRGLARFDMRIPGRLVVRVTREPGSVVGAPPPPAAVPPPSPPAPQRKPAGSLPDQAKTI